MNELPHAIKPSETQVGGDHYKKMAIQTAEFCEKNNLSFCQSAAIKYICRHEDKGGPVDIKKAIHFLTLLLEYRYSAIYETNGLDSYQELALETAQYPILGHPIVYPALGLAGEAGEVAEKVKKAMRDDNQEITPERREALKKELGDTLWYVSETARQAGLTLSEIAIANIEKLADRKKRNVIQGFGDNR